MHDFMHAHVHVHIHTYEERAGPNEFVFALSDDFTSASSCVDLPMMFGAMLHSLAFACLCMQFLSFLDIIIYHHEVLI